MDAKNLELFKDPKQIIDWAVKYANSKSLVVRHIAIEDNWLTIYSIRDKGAKKHYDDNGKQIKDYVKIGGSTYDQFDWIGTKFNLCKHCKKYRDQVDYWRKKHTATTNKQPER